MSAKKDLINFSARLPAVDKEWLEEQATKNFTCTNTELIRAVRERKERESQAGA